MWVYWPSFQLKYIKARITNCVNWNCQNSFFVQKWWKTSYICNILSYNNYSPQQNPVNWDLCFVSKSNMMVIGISVQMFCCVTLLLLLTTLAFVISKGCSPIHRSASFVSSIIKYNYITTCSKILVLCTPAIHIHER